jgi:hypothetical protein
MERRSPKLSNLSELLWDEKQRPRFHPNVKMPIHYIGTNEGEGELWNICFCTTMAEDDLALNEGFY